MEYPLEPEPPCASHRVGPSRLDPPPYISCSFDVFVSEFHAPYSDERWWALLVKYLYNRVLRRGVLTSWVDLRPQLARSSPKKQFSVRSIQLSGNTSPNPVYFRTKHTLSIQILVISEQNTRVLSKSCLFQNKTHVICKKNSIWSRIHEHLF